MKILNDLLLLIYTKIDPKKRVFPNGIRKTLNFGKVKLTINKLDFGGNQYDNNKSYEEISSKLFDLLYKDYKPTIFLDIGANYGFISSICSIKFPSVKIIAVEPSKKLIPFIEENFRLNNVDNFLILNAICGDDDHQLHNFSINPFSSQDNRVMAKKKSWVTQSVQMTSIDTILKTTQPSDFIFLKIDTQGFEEKVFRGGENFFRSNDNWIIKTEFGPNWLKSQGSDPYLFLEKLLENYDIAELPATIPYLTNSINDLFAFKLKKQNAKEFIDFITKLNVADSGWRDLIIRPK